MNSTESPSKSIRIDRPFPLPAYVKEALQKLDDEGHVAYVVGGGVRDFLLNRESKDYDIATSALPEELCRLYLNAVTVGKAFGVIKVPIQASSLCLEIATFRQDLEYQDHRHPQRVVFSKPGEDARRRDFTINALFYDPKTSIILDFTGGFDDLCQGVIRAIGHPSDRFREDALRLLRAVRFKVRLGFVIEQQTLEAIRLRARLITKISSERIRDELNLMWTGPKPDEAVQLLSELGLLTFVLPEVEAIRKMDQNVLGKPIEMTWVHLLRTLRFLSQQDFLRTSLLFWVAILHEVGKPIVSKLNEGKNLNGHELEGAKIAYKIAFRLKMTREECQKIAVMIGDHLKFKDVFQMRESTLQRFIRQDHFEELLAFHKADALATDGNLAYYEFCSARLESIKKAPPMDFYRLVDGRDLIQMGLHPGPEFSEILRVIEDLALEKVLTTKDDALEYVVKHFVR